MIVDSSFSGASSTHCSCTQQSNSHDSSRFPSLFPQYQHLSILRISNSNQRKQKNQIPNPEKAPLAAESGLGVTKGRRPPHQWRLARGGKGEGGGEGGWKRGEGHVPDAAAWGARGVATRPLSRQAVFFFLFFPYLSTIRFSTRATARRLIFP